MGRCQPVVVADFFHQRKQEPHIRLKTGIFVSALLRRTFSAGDFASVERKGAEAAGAVFIRQRFRDGRETLFTPAPQSFFGGDDGQRKFEIRLEKADADAVGKVIEREARFDPDLWVVELEAEDLNGLFEVVNQEG